MSDLIIDLRKNKRKICPGIRNNKEFSYYSSNCRDLKPDINGAKLIKDSKIMEKEIDIIKINNDNLVILED